MCSKKPLIVGEPWSGETVFFKEHLITASLNQQIAPMTDIKLIFDFCVEAHCFDDVYAKVLPAEEYEQKSSLHRLGITSMSQKDREVLSKWVSAAS